jgi:endogenous inhibitor of DNA gyrase (YacG/DUF329 family)
MAMEKCAHCGTNVSREDKSVIQSAYDNNVFCSDWCSELYKEKYKRGEV